MTTFGCSGDATEVVRDDAGDLGFEDLGPGAQPVDAASLPPCTLAGDVEATLLRPRCATSGCHTALDLAGGLDLQSPSIRSRLSGTRALTCAGQTLLVPGRPDESYLVAKLLPRPGCGAVMPLNAAAFTADEVACVRRWVAEHRPGVDADAGASTSDLGPRDAGAAEASTPCAESDRDGDGFGTDRSCATRDCDDTNLSIYPGATEACNGLDDDCNGRVDDGFVTAACGVGACRREAPLCVNGRFQACTPATPSVEVCDGVDNDCDGEVDEGVAPMRCGMGRCERTVMCAGGRFAACVPGAASAEVCDGVDNDCDGQVDENFRAAVEQTSYTQLAMRHDGCNQTSRSGPACNAAINRFCNGRGCATTGFGPVENSGDVSVVTCVRGATQNTSYTELARAHDGCNGSSQRMGPECNAAIHRYCAGRGFVSGFGPLENSGDFAAVSCLSAGAATLVNTRYSELSGSHAGCTQGVRWGPDCNAAIHRFCAGRGFASGFGPVENNGDFAAVVCVSR
ncbi:MAG: putative metal-binding motif-containing protein [Myxococcales bacterium]|nr:putative metal-binding motif-containing protein [Myxococcales bacterium]